MNTKADILSRKDQVNTKEDNRTSRYSRKNYG